MSSSKSRSSSTQHKPSASGCAESSELDSVNNNNSNSNSRNAMINEGCSSSSEQPLLIRSSSALSPARSHSGLLDGDARQQQASSFDEAVTIIAQYGRASKFRSRIKILLAILAIITFVQVLSFFFLAPPPGLDPQMSNSTNTDPLSTKGQAARNANSNDNADSALWRELNPDTHRAIFLLEGAVQLLVSILACFMLFLTHLTRNSDKYPVAFSWVPRSADGRGWTAWELVQICIWLMHCPGFGLAEHDQRLRYINALCIFRLYCVVQAGIELSEMKRVSLRFMTSFFSLKLTSGVYIRWLLEYHRWYLLIPTLIFMWLFLAALFVMAEGWSFFTAVYFCAVTMATVGYGDVAPQTVAGRLVAILTMMCGLVIVAYIVAEVQQLTTRPVHEQKVLDALSMSHLTGKVKIAAANIFYCRWRLVRLSRQPESEETEVQMAETRSRLKSFSRELRRLTKRLRLLPNVGGDGGAALSSQIKHLSAAQDKLAARIDQSQAEQNKAIADLSATVLQLQGHMSSPADDEVSRLRRALAERDEEIARLKNEMK